MRVGNFYFFCRTNKSKSHYKNPQTHFDFGEIKTSNLCSTFLVILKRFGANFLAFPSLKIYAFYRDLAEFYV